LVNLRGTEVIFCVFRVAVLKDIMFAGLEVVVGLFSMLRYNNFSNLGYVENGCGFLFQVLLTLA